MKVSSMEVQRTPSRVALVVLFTLIILTLIPIFYPLLSFRLYLLRNKDRSSSPPSSFALNYLQDNDDGMKVEEESEEACDIFTGEWVPNPHAPYYTNHTCWAIHEHQNCIKYGRPDSDFMKWRWKPDGCQLPIFNPAQFLEIVRGKSLAFVGDSVGRNQMQSLICLLSRVEYPIDVSYTRDEHFKRWLYTTYNFTVAFFWTPHLVKANEADPNGPTNTGLFGLYLDEFDENWTSQIQGFDYLILSAGHWFFRPMIFYEKSRIVGCHFCRLPYLTDLTMYYGYRKAFRTTFRAINELEGFKGVTFLRTFAPSHFEGGLWNEGGNCLRRRPLRSNETKLEGTNMGLWNEGGNCLRRRPLRSNETKLEGTNMELYMVQMEEFKAAEREGRRKGKRYRLLDTTQAMLLRPDGHPSRYGHWAHEKVTLYNDCVHWCLPGPIDSWNDFLLHMLKMEGVRSYKDRLQNQI